MMRVLVGCEYSGAVRDAFIAAGHDAVSVDLVPSEVPGPHIVGSVVDQLDGGWDLGVFFPPCTYLACVSAPALSRSPARVAELERAAEFFRLCLNAPIPFVAVENPQMLMRAQRLIGEPARQYVEPYWFGHPFTKKTGLWLRNLPQLVPTDLVDPSASWVLQNRSPRERSRTFWGLASAMATQWTNPVPDHPVPLF